ncbi:peroxisomal membrane protein 11C isoform X1 [Homo sapiens]|uniref:peroxisomal membrane protein 11C isoform X1 n=1 Tax=Homo sapiens TaxID=9606 RepID=UPI0005D00861|nr:peroxisomal membrane protein 11C isoform X1 [Homo sapiens]XP_054178596.1 peroxisomal membrane protein 11C isoform X1 [Homo sapiens]|eukprot:XP_011526728.1 peroxisomal membrane protein 11C isoform X1 [Homo sapiens]
MASLSGLASALESYRGRDRLIRVLGYCCQLVGGVLVEQCPARSEVGTRLLVVSTQLSHCRTILRLFDDLAMFVYTKQYGLGAQEEDAFVRCVSVLGNLADQLYYPCEHVAWAADARVLHVDSSRWWTLSTTLWALSLLLGVASLPDYWQHPHGAFVTTDAPPWIHHHPKIKWNCFTAIEVLCAPPAAAFLFRACGFSSFLWICSEQGEWVESIPCVLIMTRHLP